MWEPNTAPNNNNNVGDAICVLFSLLPLSVCVCWRRRCNRYPYVRFVSHLTRCTRFDTNVVRVLPALVLDSVRRCRMLFVMLYSHCVGIHRPPQHTDSIYIPHTRHTNRSYMWTERNFQPTDRTLFCDVFRTRYIACRSHIRFRCGTNVLCYMQLRMHECVCSYESVCAWWMHGSQYTHTHSHPCVQRTSLRYKIQQTRIYCKTFCPFVRFTIPKGNIWYLFTASTRDYLQPHRCSSVWVSACVQFPYKYICYALYMYIFIYMQTDCAPFATVYTMNCEWKLLVVYSGIRGNIFDYLKCLHFAFCLALHLKWVCFCVRGARTHTHRTRDQCRVREG